ncbi:peptidyl-prolyl cis-trans isomerase CYP28, chloroplastic [Cicer arietinum]|uniref:Peptidyl-prolyl cis-trans isomerase n=1 Tax=Cicer arietinum TaxID=3827 RepID=A0A1S2Z2V9_CICAR|nr:peptidyl-prolyl cis-trans isomerase CYP28, chloroplastic [Cicer arietinum]
MASSLPQPPPLPSLHFTRRSLLLTSTSTLSFPSLSSSATIPPNPTITDRVFMEFGLCPNFFLPNRTLGDTISTLCSDSTSVGRVIIGLYGNIVPLTVSNFKSLCISASNSNNPDSSSYKNTLVHKVFPGQYFLAGRQGRPEKGEVRPPRHLPRNIETVDPTAFALTHSRPGVVSLSLSENDDDDEIKFSPDYRNIEFLITTGPGPCPQLDSKNIVFGTVLEGLDVITSIASLPTYQPAERIRQFNDLAEFFGDERAQNARAIWSRPLTTVYISNCGVLEVAKPSLTPSLP